MTYARPQSPLRRARRCWRPKDDPLWMILRTCPNCTLLLLHSLHGLRRLQGHRQLRSRPRRSVQCLLGHLSRMTRLTKTRMTRLPTGMKWEPLQWSGESQNGRRICAAGSQLCCCHFSAFTIQQRSGVCMLEIPQTRLRIGSEA